MDGWRWSVLLLLPLWVAGCSGGADQAAPRTESSADTAAWPQEGSSATGEDGALTTAAPPDQSPAGGAAPGDYDPRAYMAEEPAAGDSYPATGAEPPDDAPRFSTRAEPPGEGPAAADDHVVRVFYATDREPLGATGPPVLWRHYLYSFLAGMVTLLAASCAAFLPKKVISATVAGGALAATFYLGQFAAVRAQQLRRAAEFGDRTYGAARHEVHGRPVVELGVCEVSIPPDHRVGKVESPSVLRFEFREDPAKHVVLRRVVRLPEGEFFGDLAACVEASAARQAFVFLHGYNVGFDDAVKRTAQIAYDLKFDGAAVCYSWPSHAGLANYTQDEANVAWTVTQLETFLRGVAERTGARRVHVIAHSMGNRALLQAVERMALRGDGPTFGQVVLAAPDVDAGEFRNRYAPALARVARRVTLYASSNDQALLASTKIHGYDRAGLSGPNLVVTPGCDTVDVSPIDTSLIGHSYYGDNPLMIRDLAAVIGLDLPADGRQWLRRTLLTPDAIYWAFRQDLATERL